MTFIRFKKGITLPNIQDKNVLTTLNKIKAVKKVIFHVFAIPIVIRRSLPAGLSAFGMAGRQSQS